MHLVVIGGDGTFTGALRFSKKYPDIAGNGRTRNY